MVERIYSNDEILNMLEEADLNVCTLSNSTINTLEAHSSLYIESVDSFCKDQQNIIKYLNLYKKVKCGEMLEGEVETLYAELSGEYEHSSYPAFEEFGSKLSFLEYEIFRLIKCYEKCLLTGVNTSLKRLSKLICIVKSEK